MGAQSLLDHLSDLTTLTLAFKEELASMLEVENYKPHQIIHAAGQIENRLWYVEEGFARSYYFDQTGKEHTLSFFKEREIIFSHKGYWKENTDFYIEVLTSTRFISIKYEDLHDLINRYQETTILIQIFVRQQYYQDVFKSRLMTWPAEERYHQFRKANPDVFKLASIRLIASYLNMTRENLSRIMSK